MSFRKGGTQSFLGEVFPDSSCFQPLLANVLVYSTPTEMMISQGRCGVNENWRYIPRNQGKYLFSCRTVKGNWEIYWMDAATLEELKRRNPL
jgi:hypothetical protein